MDPAKTGPRPSVGSPPTAPSGSVQKGRQRTITACLTCRRRKVKCDHAQPICSPCQRGNRICTYVNPQLSSQTQPHTTANRVSRPNLRTGQDEIRNRLERLEKLLEKAIAGGENTVQPSDAQEPGLDTPHDDQRGVASGVFTDRKNETLSVDGYDGALLLEPESGQSRWVSSLHYALLADEVRGDNKTWISWPRSLTKVDSRRQNATRGPSSWCSWRKSYLRTRNHPLPIL